MMSFLNRMAVLLKDFGTYAGKTTNLLRERSCEAARRLNRRIEYLRSSKIAKDSLARHIAEQDGIREGLICILTCVEPCMSYETQRNRQEKKLVLAPQPRKCLHLYHYIGSIRSSASWALAYKRGFPSRSRSVSMAGNGWRTKWTSEPWAASAATTALSALKTTIDLKP